MPLDIESQSRRTAVNTGYSNYSKGKHQKKPSNMLGGGFRDNSMGKAALQKFVVPKSMMQTNYNNPGFTKPGGVGSSGRVNEILLES